MRYKASLFISVWLIFLTYEMGIIIVSYLIGTVNYYALQCRTVMILQKECCYRVLLKSVCKNRIFLK